MASNNSDGRWTDVPRAWTGHRLFDWGRGGLRSDGNVWVRPGPGYGRPRKSFDFHVGRIGFAEIDVGGDRRLLFRVRKLAPDEVWPVYVRRGVWWCRHHYIVPADALREAREQLAVERAA